MVLIGKKINELCKEKDYDIILIQETHNGFTKELIPYIEDGLNGIILNREAKFDIKGEVAIFIKSNKNIRWERKMESNFFKGRLLHLIIENIHIINIYFPTNKYKKFDFIDKLDK